ncbi:MAG: ubiquinol-cytochrome c reductase iron-sulfur subunit, partial [Zetaproteobacteria bacterium]
VQWRGKPLFILHRTPEMIQSLYGHDDLLRDPMSRAIPEVQADWMKTKEQRITRAIKPEFLIVIGACTHLGCVPMFKPTKKPGDDSVPKRWPGGWHCACHGSLYDLAGRVFKGVPAPYNLFLPPYRYIDDTIVRIG